ncbi:MAG: hypothetical protein Q4A65_07085 [Bacillota bacterium]|nr:hypothetical protein [Bacillota bacterium]
MKRNQIRFDMIYKNKLPMEEDVYAYIRAWQGDEVGFSVLDRPTNNPDFSKCGVFWVTPDNFWIVFEEFKLRHAI